MRVLELVTTAEWGGAQAQVVLIAGEFARRGHDVHVASGGHGDLGARAAAAGAVVHELRWLRTAVHPLRDLLALGEIRALVRTLGPDLIHTHSSKAGVLGRLVGSWEGVPVVHTCHGLAWGPGRRGGPAAWAFRSAERLTGSAVRAVVCVSDDVLAAVKEQRLYPRAVLRRIYNGVDLGLSGPGPFPESSGESPFRFPAAREALGLPADCRLVVLVARLVPGKGHRLALEAWEKLAQAVPPAALILVGDGPLLPGLTEEARRLGRPGREVLCLGYRDDVPAVLRAADALVLPSQAEGLGIVVVEAMAAGLPVVASDLPSLREMVVPGETGLLFDLRSGAEALARALETVLTDPDRARRMGKAGRSRAEALFALHNVAQTVDFLSDMAACRGSARTAEVADG